MKRLLVYREPTPTGYARELSLGAEESVSVDAFPDASFSVGELLG